MGFFQETYFPLHRNAIYNLSQSSLRESVETVELLKVLQSIHQLHGIVNTFKRHLTFERIYRAQLEVDFVDSVTNSLSRGDSMSV